MSRRKYIMIAIFIFTLIIGSMPTSNAAASSFNDINGHWAYEYIVGLYLLMATLQADIEK